MANPVQTPADIDNRIHALVAQIPAGCVASYGQLAVLAGLPGGARRAARAVKNSPPHLPCHRVVNSNGRIAPGWPAQRALLQAEGVAFTRSGNADIKRHRWQPWG